MPTKAGNFLFSFIDLILCVFLNLCILNLIVICLANDSPDNSDSSSEDEDEIDLVLEELERKKKHPARLHPELWYVYLCNLFYKESYL